MSGRSGDALPGPDLKPLPSSEAAHGASEARRSGPQHRPDLILWLRLTSSRPASTDLPEADEPWPAPSVAWRSSGPPWGSRAASPTSRDTAPG